MNGSSRLSFAEELDELIYEGVSLSDGLILSESNRNKLKIIFCLNTFNNLLGLLHRVKLFNEDCEIVSIISMMMLTASMVSKTSQSSLKSLTLCNNPTTDNGGKFTMFWWGALVHGVICEQGFGSQKYWHAQAPIMFFGKQLPLHIVFLYPSIIYLSMMGVHRLKLNVCTEPTAVGLIAMLIEIPYRIISVKFLHITYHDSDPLLHHKLCGVPWLEIFSSMLRAYSYVAIYHGAHFFYSKDLSTIWDSSKPEIKQNYITAFCALVSPIGAFLLKILLFHFFNDFFNVNPIACLFFAVSVFLSFVICFDSKKVQKTDIEDTNNKTYLIYELLIFIFSLLALALFGRPQNEISVGSHEPTGDCSILICSRTPLGKPLKRKKYLCVDEVSARKNFVYNFECLDDGPPCLHAIWYTICGSPIHNRIQFFLIVLSFIILISTFFAKTLLEGVKTLEEAKKLVVRFRREIRPNESEGAEPASEEVTVGLVLVKNNIKFLPKDYQTYKKT